MTRKEIRSIVLTPQRGERSHKDQGETQVLSILIKLSSKYLGNHTKFLQCYCCLELGLGYQGENNYISWAYMCVKMPVTPALNSVLCLLGEMKK